MKYISFITGLALVLGISYCGYYSVEHTGFVPWFGVITAVVSPLAFEFLLFPFKSRDKQVIKKLSKVTEIEALIQKAEDNEAKIRLLERQKQELANVIAYESKRRTLEAEKQIYLLQASESLKNIQKVNEELEVLTATKQEFPEYLLPLLDLTSTPSENVIQYNFNGRHYILKKSTFTQLPVYGGLFFELIKSFDTLLKKAALDDSKQVQNN